MGSGPDSLGVAAGSIARCVLPEQYTTLTASNPTRCGFAYDAESILAPLNNPAALEYEPDPRGLRTAREAVSLYYRDHTAAIDPEQIFLTTSTSEAYSFLFRLLCDPGDEVLIGQPGYPLFDFLAQLDDARLVPYPLFYDHGWHLDLEALRRRVTPRTRAIALVHPNNPTGHFTHPQERAAIEEVCREHGLALIVDEVFLDYRFPRGRPWHSELCRRATTRSANLRTQRLEQSGRLAADEGSLDCLFWARLLCCGHGAPGGDLGHLPLHERSDSARPPHLVEPAISVAIQDQIKHAPGSGTCRTARCELLLRQKLVTRLHVEAG